MDLAICSATDELIAHELVKHFVKVVALSFSRAMGCAEKEVLFLLLVSPIKFVPTNYNQGFRVKTLFGRLYSLLKRSSKSDKLKANTVAFCAEVVAQKNELTNLRNSVEALRKEEIVLHAQPSWQLEDWVDARSRQEIARHLN